MKKLLEYIKQHIAAELLLAMMGLVGIFALVFGWFLRNQSYKYMVDNIYYTESEVLRVVNKDMKETLYPIIHFGIENAVSTELTTLVKKYEEGDETADRSIAALLKHYTYPGDVVALAVVGKKGKVAEYDRYRNVTKNLSVWSRINEERLQEIYEQATAQYSDFQFLELPKYFYFQEPSLHPAHSWLGVFHIVYPILDSTGSHIQYILVMTVKSNVLKDELAMLEAQQDDAARAFIVDSSDVVIYSSLASAVGKNISEVQTFCPGMKKLKDGELGLFGWKICVYLDEGRIRGRVNAIYKKSYLLFGVILVGFIFFAYIFTRSLLQPVRAISAAMKKLNSESKPATIEIKGSHELWQLTEEYNRMAVRLEEKTREVEEQHKKAITSLERAYDAEREALESQINAHFICNTIGVINFEAIDAEAWKVSVLLKKLSNILRYSFERKAQSVYLGQEIAWTEQYLFLQKERFGELFDYVIDTDETYDDWPACKLMLQPFVENSILHGFAKKKQGGMIRVGSDIDTETGRLALTISDNGDGMTREQENGIQEMICAALGEKKENDSEIEGVGIRNVVTRMSMFYGPELKILFSSRAGQGTKFVFFLPYPGEGTMQ